MILTYIFSFLFTTMVTCSHTGLIISIKRVNMLQGYTSEAIK